MESSRHPRSRSPSPQRLRPKSPGSIRKREEALNHIRRAQWEVAQEEVEEAEQQQQEGGLAECLARSRLGPCLCTLTVVLVRLLVLLLVVWLVSFLHAGLGVPCFMALFTLWVHSERQHQAFSGYFKDLCNMVHGTAGRSAQC